MGRELGEGRSGLILRHLCAFLLLGALAATLFPADGWAADALDDYNVAIGLYKQKRWDLAADSLQNFVRSYPKHPKIPYAKLYLGLALVKMNQYKEARDILRAYAADYPNSRNLPDAMYRVAECSYLLNDFKQAEKEFVEFLKRYNDHELAEWALPYLADSQLRLDDPETAAANFRKSLDRFPKGRMAEDSTFGLARAYESLKQPDKAVELYEQLAADTTSPRAPQALLSLATAYYDAGEYDRAAKTYSDLEQRYAGSPLAAQARLNGGYAYFQAGDYRKAAEQFDRAAGDKDQTATATYWKGMCYKYLRQYDQAAEILKSAFDANPGAPLAESVLYQLADCRLRAGKNAAAVVLFLDVVQRWPQGEFADESLHFAAEAALMANQLDKAEELIEQFARDFAGSSLRMHQRLLRGRLLDSRGRLKQSSGEAEAASKSFQEATAEFDYVLSNSRIPHTQSLARFHLARTLQKRGQHEKAIELLEPLVQEARQKGAESEFVDALLLSGISHEAAKLDEAAVTVLSDYLRLLPEGEQADRALATRAVSLARLGRKADVRSDLTTLAVGFPGSPLLAKTTHTLAEDAYERQDWNWAFELFGSLENAGNDSPYHAAGLSGQAWTRFQQKKYKEAAVLFGRVVTEHADDQKLAPEAAYMHAQSLQEVGQLEEAAVAYARTFQKLAPAADSTSSGQQQSSAKYAFLAGLQAARTLRRLDKISEADAAYADLLKRFPKPQDLDRLLDEWALLNYEAGRYERADEIFRRLVKESPQSELADNALLSLAETNLVDGEFDAAGKIFIRLLDDPKSDDTVREVSMFHLIEIAVEQQEWKGVESTAERFLNKFPQSKRRLEAQLHVSEARLQQDKLDEARQTLSELTTALQQSESASEEWVPRVSVLFAETLVRLKQYDELFATVDEFRRQNPNSPLLYQLDEVLGRAHKNRGEFDLARAAFERVIAHPDGRKTETAAKSQFFIAETHLMQNDVKTAQREYLKVYLLYKFPDWQAHALYQAARCDEALGQWDRAAKAYEELIRDFTDSDSAAKAKERLEIVQDQLTKKAAS